jgi:hypothetical protein
MCKSRDRGEIVDRKVGVIEFNAKPFLYRKNKFSDFQGVESKLTYDVSVNFDMRGGPVGRSDVNDDLSDLFKHFPSMWMVR